MLVEYAPTPHGSKRHQPALKAAANGALNISIPDGWWCEAEETRGKTAGASAKGETYDSTEEQDQVESEALYEILENEVAPMFYNRGRDGLPREWIARMKTAIRTIAPMFNTYRMVLEYGDRFYVPCCKRRHRLFENKRQPVYKLAEWKSWIRNHWKEVHVMSMESGNLDDLEVGNTIDVFARHTTR